MPVRVLATRAGRKRQRQGGKIAHHSGTAGVNRGAVARFYEQEAEQ